MNEPYSTFDICKALEIPKERFREWMIRGFVQPSIYLAQRQGEKSLFSKQDVYTVALFKHLIEKCHLPREEAGRFIKSWLAKVEDKSPALYNILIFRLYDNEIAFVLYFSMHGMPVEDLRAYEAIRFRATEEVHDKPWDAILIVNFEKILKEVDLALS